MLETLKKEHRRKMDAAVADLNRSFDSLRTGRASLSLIDRLKVEAYGSEMPIMQVATLSTPDARTIAISPFDPSQIKAVEKAIIASDVGITPSNDGKTIRLNVPQLTEERRKDLVKLAKRYAEDHRVAVRQVRHHINDELKKLQKDGDISEDEFHMLLDEVQKMTDAHVKIIDETLKAKEEEIMAV